MSDALDDLHDFFAHYVPTPAEMLAEHPSPVRVAPVPAGFFPIYVRQREALLMDVGFLLACNALAPDLFGDLVAWRVGGTSVAQHHATSRPATVAADQQAAARARRHREYTHGMRVRSLREAV